MENTVNINDPRVKRTRGLLLKAFGELAQEKDIRSIKVQDIADRATLNRATFYAHFNDKEALMDAAFRSILQSALTSQLTLDSPFTQTNLRLLFRVVCEFISTTLYRCPRTTGAYRPLVKAEIQEELFLFLLNWLKSALPQHNNENYSQETLARVISWSLFGGAIDYSRNPGTLSQEKAAERVVGLLTEGLGNVITLNSAGTESHQG